MLRGPPPNPEPWTSRDRWIWLVLLLSAFRAASRRMVCPIAFSSRDGVFPNPYCVALPRRTSGQPSGMPVIPARIVCTIFEPIFEGSRCTVRTGCYLRPRPNVSARSRCSQGRRPVPGMAAEGRRAEIDAGAGGARARICQAFMHRRTRIRPWSGFAGPQTWVMVRHNSPWVESTSRANSCRRIWRRQGTGIKRLPRSRDLHRTMPGRRL